jgi:ankyrin repeat protein
MTTLQELIDSPLGRRALTWCCAACLTLASNHACPQQSPKSGAVETFDPAFDVVIEHRPRAGIYGITELMMAALEADILKAGQLIDGGADVNETDDSQSTPLMWGVHSGDVEIVKYLISEGADVRATAFQGATALINAISAKQEAIAIVLIEAGADPNGRGNSRQNHLEAAADSGMTGVVDALIRNGTDLSSYGSSALSYAAARGHYDIAVLLLDAGVDATLPAGSSEVSILSRASATGNLDLVKLLLSHGVAADQPEGQRSPLAAAVSRGNTAVARLLIDNGATVTSQHVLEAIRQRNVDTAIILIDLVNVDALQTSEVSGLLDAANELGNDAVVQKVLQFESVRAIADERAKAQASAIRAASREHSRLLFARQNDADCIIAIWDSSSGDTTELAKITECPNELFVSDDGHSAFVVDGSVVRIVSTSSPLQRTDIMLPTLDYRNWVNQMTPRPDQNPDYLPSASTMTLAGVGRFEDGSIGLLATLWMPADDSFNYVFRRNGTQWTIVESHWCDRWGCEHPLDSLQFRSTNVWSWPETSMIWHENLKMNPFFVGESVPSVDLEYESYPASVYQREFGIDGTSSVLHFHTSPSEHSDTNHTFGIELVIDDGNPIQLSGNQCLTSIVGRHILVNEFVRGRFEVTDLGTGETVLGDLKAALWLD